MRRHGKYKLTRIPWIFRFRTTRLNKFAWSPEQTTCYFDPAMDRGFKNVRQFKYFSEAFGKLVKELKETKPLWIQHYCKNDEKNKKILKPWGVRIGEKVGDILKRIVWVIKPGTKPPLVLKDVCSNTFRWTGWKIISVSMK